MWHKHILVLISTERYDDCVYGDCVNTPSDVWTIDTSVDHTVNNYRKYH